MSESRPEVNRGEYWWKAMGSALCKRGERGRDSRDRSRNLYSLNEGQISGKNHPRTIGPMIPNVSETLLLLPASQSSVGSHFSRLHAVATVSESRLTHTFVNYFMLFS